jgi:redox-sensitive bicupin YhaK (pirin superfamily)
MTDTATLTRTAGIERRGFETLGHANHGWLDARHHFSFANYHDPARMSWGAIRVWNDDTIAPNSGFPPHPHRDMEIITYVRKGAITHQDSLGNTGRTEAGDVQVMSAGSGVRHAEYNLESEPTTLFQIWIEPTRSGGAPSWGAKPFPKDDRTGKFVTLASGFEADVTGSGAALPIRAEARVLAATLAAGETLSHDVGEGRHAYLVPATGAIEIDGQRFAARDGVAITGGRTITITAIDEAELVLVDAN